MEIEAVSVVRKMFISHRLGVGLNQPFILHNLHALIRLSPPKQAIYHTGWVGLVGDWEQPNHGSSYGPISKRGGKKKSPVNVGSGMRIPITIGPLVA